MAVHLDGGAELVDMDRLTADEMDTVRGVLYALELIRAQTAHGSIRLNVVNGVVTEIDMEQRIRPQITAPWRDKPA